MLYRARSMIPMDGRAPIHDAALAVRGDRIAGAGPWAEMRAAFGGEPVTDLGEQVILPGLINAHCHLDYSTMRGAISPRKTFTEWIACINALKRDLDADALLAAVAAGFRECARHGTTTVLNLEAFPELLPRMPAPPLRTWWFYEMIDLRQRIAPGELAAGAQAFFQERPEWLGGFGLGPHAPYTASPALYAGTRECARRARIPWTTHLNESRDEWEMFAEARGPLHALLAGIGRPMGDCGGGRTALERLAETGALGPECLAVHMNLLSERDFQLLSAGGRLHGLNVVHCPLSHAYFQHPPFPLTRLLAAGVNLCVGTDSLASNGSLDLLAELRALARGAATGATPPALELLKMVTTNPARALGLEAQLGTFQPGAWADFIALPDNGALAQNLYFVVLSHGRPITCVHVAGQPVII